MNILGGSALSNDTSALGMFTIDESYLMTQLLEKIENEGLYDLLSIEDIEDIITELRTLCDTIENGDFKALIEIALSHMESDLSHSLLSEIDLERDSATLAQFMLKEYEMLIKFYEMVLRKKKGG